MCPFVRPAFQVFVFASSWTNLHARLAHNETATAAAGRPGWTFQARPTVDNGHTSIFFSFFVSLSLFVLAGCLLKAHIWALNVLGKYVLNGKTCKGCFGV